jgi:hypothetical protein
MGSVLDPIATPSRPLRTRAPIRNLRSNHCLVAAAAIHLSYISCA